ncbi:MAG: hypothetical protein ABII80_03660, partial [bacterium]
ELGFQFRSTFLVSVWPIWAIGISSLLTDLGASASFFFSDKIIKRFPKQNILLFRSIYGKITSIISYGFPSVLSPLILSTPSLLYGVGSVAENDLMQHEFTDHQRATMSSLNSLGGSLGFAIMSLGLGSLADAWGPAKALIIFSILSIPNIYIYWLLFRKDRKMRA